MTVQTLTPPQDITWTRMAFARDMIDTNFGDQLFRPKWRSSLAVYYYFVPEEETADAYPNSRIVYLKFTASITGFNPSEELLGVKKAAEEAGTWDDLQRTLWQVIVSSGWAATYWPCLGAIMQLAVYPSNAEGVTPGDYPYIMDFEPKKRELFEQVTEGNEFLAGSAETVSTTKGSTNTQSVGAKGGGTFLGIGITAGTVEAAGGALYFGGSLAQKTALMATGAKFARFGGGVGLTVVSGYQFIGDVERGDVGGAVGSGSNTVAGITMLATTNPAAIVATGTFALSYNGSRWIRSETGWGNLSARGGIAVANAIMGDEPGIVRKGAGYGVGFVVTAGGVLIVEPIGFAGKKIGQGVSWGYDKITDLIGYEFDF